MTTRRMNASAPTRPVIWLGVARVSVAAVVIALLQCMPFRHLSNQRGKTGRKGCARPTGAQDWLQVVTAPLRCAAGRCSPWDSLESCGLFYWSKPARNGRERRDQARLAHRSQHHLGGRHGRPRHVHAGGLRIPRGGPDADEECRPHRGQERADLRHLLDRLLGGRLRDRLRRRQLAGRHARLLPLGHLAHRGRQGAVGLVLGDPGRRRLPLRGRLRRRLARDRLGRDGRAGQALGLLRLRRLVHDHLLDRLALDLEPARLALRTLRGHAGLRRLDRRPLPGRAGRPRRAR